MSNNQEQENIIKEVAKQKEAKQKKAEEYSQYIVFELDKEEYAVNITDLQEIIRIPEVTPVPNSPNFIKGIFNLRGEIIIVVDLEKRFNLKRDHDKEQEEHIIVTEVNKNNYGIIVDRVTEIINITKSSIQSTPDLISSKIHADYLKGVVVLEEKKRSKSIYSEKEGKKGSRLVILLDLSKMLLEEELLSFGDNLREATKK